MTSISSPVSLGRRCGWGIFGPWLSCCRVFPLSEVPLIGAECSKNMPGDDGNQRSRLLGGPVPQRGCGEPPWKPKLWSLEPRPPCYTTLDQVMMSRSPCSSCKATRRGAPSRACRSDLRVALQRGSLWANRTSRERARGADVRPGF